jgi:hypothetical protein
MSDDLRTLLEDLRAFLEDQADAEYFTDRAGPVGNEAMRLMVRVDEELDRAAVSEVING